MRDAPVVVRYEVAEDEQFRKIAQKGTFHALPELAHSVHAEVEGLAPGRPYFFRFFAGDEVSPTGRTRTSPAPEARPDRLKLGYGSCQHFEQGYYAAHRHLAEEDLDLMVFLGDYIYESTWGEDLVRYHSDEGAVARTLEQYRNRHAQYRLDEDLQRLHGQVPWIVTWDDHEVANDYAGFASERLEPDFAARRQAGYQAFWEHMPLRMSQLPRRARTRIYGTVAWGQLARLHVLDGRQYKTKQACPRPGMGGGNFLDACPEAQAAVRSFLGREQEAWLEGQLAENTALWSLLAQQTLVAPLDRTPGPGSEIWTDGWSGYPAARRRLLAALGKPSVKNAFVLGGDIHCFVAADLRADPEDPDSPIIAGEVCGTSISSQGPDNAELEALLPENPHVHAALSERGYTTLTVTPDAAHAELRVVDDVRKKDASVRTHARFTMEAGAPGLQTG
jgi:alkaline phosphatase D